MSSPSAGGGSPKHPLSASALKKTKASANTLAKAQTFLEGRPPWYDTRGSIKARASLLHDLIYFP